MNGLFFGLFMVFVVVMLMLDLFVFHKKDKVVSVKEAAIWTGIWVSLAMGFAVLVYFFGDWMMPPAEGMTDLAAYRKEMMEEFLAGYFLEESLSIDNIFVMIMIFVSFGIKREYYHRVLFWGIFGAIVLRFIFIFALGALVTEFSWLLAIFGAILIYSGIKMFLDKGDEQVDTENHPVVKFASKHFPVTRESHGHDFFHLGKMTPLFLVLLVIEFSDIIFAVDSIPAVFSVTKNPVIVYTSNIFAIMGLRSLFFLLSDVADRFWLLHYGLGALLTFIGVKMICAEFFGWHIPTLASLAVILGILVVSVVLSMMIKKPVKAE
ncbi:MAG: TerC family protein [Bacteroidales bacterium]|nr:TerC family protein [Bacteroidales bacterium]